MDNPVLYVNVGYLKEGQDYRYRSNLNAILHRYTSNPHFEEMWERFLKHPGFDLTTPYELVNDEHYISPLEAIYLKFYRSNEFIKRFTQYYQRRFWALRLYSAEELISWTVMICNIVIDKYQGTMSKQDLEFVLYLIRNAKSLMMEWKPSIHKYWPDEFHNIVKAFLMTNERGLNLPQDVVHKIIKHFNSNGCLNGKDYTGCNLHWLERGEFTLNLGFYSDFCIIQSDPYDVLFNTTNFVLNESELDTTIKQFQIINEWTKEKKKMKPTFELLGHKYRVRAVYLNVSYRRLFSYITGVQCTNPRSWVHILEDGTLYYVAKQEECLSPWIMPLQNYLSASTRQGISTRSPPPPYSTFSLTPVDRPLPSYSTVQGSGKHV
eukprot:TRINITY_DN1992_c0_g1_i2.p1 TRINITY_DN1992_c0_g1~~TRINITY_DN1992_c0_g1_i2.p1  ORF type:complete len:378 (-),score=43.92 TRINITY_DN1992_c0_g1_i2:228-1361(-)